MRKTTTLLVMGATAAMLPACATVDLAQVAAPAPAAAVAEDTNVVQRAVAKLKAAFARAGFGPDSSKRKMHAAADMLLNGLSETTEGAVETRYSEQGKSAPVITADIALARRHIEQTTRAAEVYLEVAPSSRELLEELKALEAALMASEGASREFTLALEGSDDAAAASELKSMRGTVDALRRITDDFGLRVRMQRSDKIALSRANGQLAN